jgi:hypothetical protein
VAVLEDGRAQFPASIGRIGSSGDFTLAVTDGTYSVSVQGLPEGYRVKSARFGSLDVLSAPMRINGSSSDEIRVLLTPPDSTAVGGKVRGHVSSAPLAEIPANVWVSMQPDPLPAGRLIAGAVPVQRDGSFEFSSLKIGNYKMRVELRPDAPLAGNFWIGMSEQSVFVNAFDFDGITIPLLPGAPVSGKVAAIGAADRSKIFVGFSGLTSHYAQFFPVAPDGSFRIWIPAGNYRVRIRPTGGPDTVRTRMMDSAVDLEMIKTNGITAVGPLEVVVGQNP